MLSTRVSATGNRQGGSGGGQRRRGTLEQTAEHDLIRPHGGHCRAPVRIEGR